MMLGFVVVEIYLLSVGFVIIDTLNLSCWWLKWKLGLHNPYHYDIIQIHILCSFNINSIQYIDLFILVNSTIWSFLYCVLIKSLCAISNL